MIEAQERRSYRIDVVSTVLLAVAAVATAWTAAQVTRWRDTHSSHSTKSTVAHIEASRAFTRAGAETQVDIATFIRQVYNWEFELTQNYLYLLPDPTLGVQRLYISGNIKKGTPFANAAGYENKDVDAAFAAAQTENDVARRKELFARVQRLIQEDLPALNLFELSFVTLYNSKLVNHTMGADGPYGSFRDTYLQP